TGIDEPFLAEVDSACLIECSAGSPTRELLNVQNVILHLVAQFELIDGQSFVDSPADEPGSLGGDRDVKGAEFDGGSLRFRLLLATLIRAGRRCRCRGGLQEWIQVKFIGGYVGTNGDRSVEQISGLQVDRGDVFVNLQEKLL